MKTKLFALIVLIVTNIAFSQKMSPDLDLISELIAKKQDEIKQRFIKNIVVKNIKTTNYTTYNSMYNLMDVLTTEKNKTVMSKSIVTIVANYSINYALASDFMRSSDFTDIPVKSRLTGTFGLGKLNVEGIRTITDVENRRLVEQKLTIDSKVSNYIVDRFYEKLIALEISEFKEKGLFKKELLENYFKEGLGIDDTGISSGRKATIDGQIDTYLSKFSGKLAAGVGIYNFLKNNISKLNDLKQVPKKDVQMLFDLFLKSLEEFKADKGGNSFLYSIGNIITKYVIYEFNNEDTNVVFKEFKIDVEAIILDLEDNFFNKGKSPLKNHFVGLKPFFTIGMNYATFTSTKSTISSDDNTSTINDVSFVSEKLGLKIILADFGYSRCHKPNEPYLYRGKLRYWETPVVAPLINDIYISIYGSGILYNVVNLKSKENFNFGLVGINAGVTFFNGLEVNVSLAEPIIDRRFSPENTMFIVGVDIPIFEYIKALNKKNR
ncbi:hypothetical protein [Flavobacterium sp.]